MGDDLDPKDPKDQREITRRRFLQAGSALAVSGAAGLASSANAERGDGRNDEKHGRKDVHSHHGRGASYQRRPHILLMVVDEMRFPVVYEAPALEFFRRRYLRAQRRLKRNGVEFLNHYAASTACAPSRTSIFTGHYPSLHGVTQTTGAAKEANDPDVFWLDPASVPTMGDYFNAGGYQTYYKGKWHVSDADLQIPGTHNQLLSYDDRGRPEPRKEKLYLEADRLKGYGFEGWIGPEPHGKAPLNSGSSPAMGQGRDVGFASQTIELLGKLGAQRGDQPWLTVCSFVNPHDIALWGYFTRFTGLYNFSVEDIVPSFSELFDVEMFARSIADNLSEKPSCQKSYQESYSIWMQGIPPEDYWRLYYQLQKNVDEQMNRVLKALERSRFYDDTLVVFTSDHGDLLGSHHYMHQKWYQTYEEALHVPLIFSNPRLFPEPRTVSGPTSHVDLLPTLLGMANLDSDELLPVVEVGHSDAVPLVGRDLSGVVRGQRRRPQGPIYFMTDDDPSRGLDQDNFYGVAFDSVSQPNHIESIVVELEGATWKYSRYFDNEQFWSNPSASLVGIPPKDVVVHVDDTQSNVPGEHPVDATERVKFKPLREEFEMYNLDHDPMELDNLSGNQRYAQMERRLAAILVEQNRTKRLRPISGDVPGQPGGET